MFYKPIQWKVTENSEGGGGISKAKSLVCNGKYEAVGRVKPKSGGGMDTSILEQHNSLVYVCTLQESPPKAAGGRSQGIGLCL